MKSKYLVIFVLFLALSMIIYFMIKIENRYFTVNAPTASVAQIPRQYDKRELVINQSEEYWTDRINGVRLVCKAFGDNFAIAKTIRGDKLQTNELSFEEVFIKGVNIGAAVPGSFPGEFAASKEQYYQWLIDIGKMNANAVRVYTILPPIFYATLAKYNADHPERKLWLIQGIWTEQPPSGNYLDMEFLAEFKREIGDAVDVIFGRANLPDRPGHASGKYVVDVSDHTLGFILGREWEPQGITQTNKANRGTHSFDGRFFSVPEGNPMEIFLANCMDYLMAYETSAYGFQHPISFVDWLPLDPLYHNSEWLEGERISEFDNDLESIDPMHIFTTPSNKAGYFASYHVYPYYPDFIYNDSTYRLSKCSDGPCTYYGYINDLKAHHAGLPLLIAEYGVPTSRSSSHSMPMGMNQGKHTENEQGKINAHLTKDIHESGCAGALLFSWIDEWFKHNWLVMEFEIPMERNKLWHNLEDPEQCFGIAALEDTKIRIDGESDDWKNSKSIKDKKADIAGNIERCYDLDAIRFASDATCFYLKLEFAGPIPKVDTAFWRRFGILVAIDTYDKEKGDHLISQVNEILGRGAEFLLDIRGPGQTSLLVDTYYDVCNDYSLNSKPQYRSIPNSDGVFNVQKMIPNRRRHSLTGEIFPEIISYRGELSWRNEKNRDPGDATLDDVAFCDDDRSIELRIPWALLNVTDPSSRYVLDDKSETDNLDYSVTDGFRLYVFTYDPSSDSKTAIDKFPDNPAGPGIEYTWKTWEKPDYEYRLKYGYSMMKEIFAKFEKPLNLSQNEKNHQITPTAAITKWPAGKQGAVTLTFDDASYGQYKYAFPIVQKYNQGGTFFLVTGWIGDEAQVTGENDGLQTLRLSWSQVKEISASGFEIGAHGHEHTPLDHRMTVDWIKESMGGSKALIEKHIEAPCVSLSYPYSVITESHMSLLAGLGFRFGRRGGSMPNDYDLSNYLSLYSYPVIDTARPHYGQLHEELRKNNDKWTILIFHHIFPENATEWKTFAHYNVKDTYALTPLDFERYIRLIRNSNYAAGSIRQIGDYIITAKSSVLKFEAHDNHYTIQINSHLSEGNYQAGLSIRLSTPWRYLQVDGSMHDGIYEARNGMIIFWVAPNTTVIVRKLEG